MSKPEPGPLQHPGPLLLLALAAGCASLDGDRSSGDPAPLGEVRRPVARARLAAVLPPQALEVSGRTAPAMPDRPVVLALRPASGAICTAAGEVVLEQRAGGMSPEFVVVPVGYDVAFVNRDSVCHRYFSVSDPDPFELPLLKPHERAVRRMLRPGFVQVHCQLHSGRQATVLVVPSPHYALANSRGEFAIGDLGPGSWVLETWCEGFQSEPLAVDGQPSGAPPLEVPLSPDSRGSM